MANTSKKKKPEKEYSVSTDKGFRKQLSAINNLIGQANLSMYGTDRTSDVDVLNSTFQTILQNQIGDLTNRNNEDITSFLGQIVSADHKTTAIDEMLSNQFMAITGDEYSTLQSFIYDAYRNRLFEQSDLHEVSSQLIELNQAILITRDAIISTDIVEGRMSRNFNFDNIDDDEIENNTSIIEKMEKKFKLLEKIKNFIIPKTLEYGEYYVYVIPYSKLFSQISKTKENDLYGRRMFREMTILESFSDNTKSKGKKKNDIDDSLEYFLESTYDKFNIQESTRSSDITNTEPEVSKDEFKKDLKNILGNISVCNESVPLPVLEEGFETLEYFKEYTESVMTEANSKKDKDLFNTIASATITDKGITFDNSGKEPKSENFDDINDCYVKMIEPTRMVPINIMNTNIGYYYVQAEDITPLSGAISSTLYYTKFDEHRREATIIDSIAERVIKSFDKPFLMKNLKFKEAIVDCFQYYNLNEKRLKFQFIPSEYVQVFKIEEDENGKGRSMIKDSLFYAKLYLMLLLFKITSIILYSNDEKVNYVKQSGIDKDLANKVQEIARIKQNRRINITDLFSYTTLINKVGSGAEQYIPTGRGGERPIETEILQGQDIQLNTDLLEMLKNAYILGTGVPAAIMNYLHEADFAKTQELNNTKYAGRVVNYQLDFNSAITEMYKKIMRWSTNIPDNIIDNFSFILQPPKITTINTKSETVGQFSQLADFMVSISYPDPNNDPNGPSEDLQREIREFRKLLAYDQMPMLDEKKVQDLMEKAKINAEQEKLKPSPNNGMTNDDGLEDELNNINV